MLSYRTKKKPSLSHQAWAYVGVLKPRAVRDDTALTDSSGIKKTSLFGLPMHLMRPFSLAPPFHFCCPTNSPTSPGGCSSHAAH